MEVKDLFLRGHGELCFFVFRVVVNFHFIGHLNLDVFVDIVHDGKVEGLREDLF